MTSAISTVALPPQPIESGGSRRMNAMKMVRNPVSSRSPALLRSPLTTSRETAMPCPVRLARLTVSSPALESTRSGSRMARIVPMTNSTAA